MRILWSSKNDKELTQAKATIRELNRQNQLLRTDIAHYQELVVVHTMGEPFSSTAVFTDLSKLLEVVTK